MKKTIQFINRYRKLFIWAFIIANISLAFLYVYSINKTVFNAVALQKSQSALIADNAKLGDLQSKYIALKNSITLDYAYAHGFVDSSASQKFISQAPIVNQALSFNAI